MLDPQVRRKARERALQILFGLDFTNYPYEEAVELFWKFTPAKPSVKNYAEQLVRGVCEHFDELDNEVADALQTWSPDRIGRIERNIIRLAFFEMRYVKDVPPAVAINEAIEIAKLYGADDAPRFINGVLDRLFKKTKKKPKEKDQPDD